MDAERTYRIIVTGEHKETSLPTRLSDGATLAWRSVPVLEFEKIPVEKKLVETLIKDPVDWIIFTSERSVRFWGEVLMEGGVDFPVKTQVACMGEHTAKTAELDGFAPDFYPTEHGSEKFLEEFESLLSNHPDKPSIFLPMAHRGRTTIRDRLVELGCKVTPVPLYRTLHRKDIANLLSSEELEKADLILFTSPSSFDAFTKSMTLPRGIKIAGLGRYTCSHLQAKGLTHVMLPEGDFQRIGEILC